MKYYWKKKIAFILIGVLLLDGVGFQKVSAQESGYALNNPVNTMMDGSGVSTWDCIWFGNYYQNDTNGDGVADEQDEKQPIKWRVLSINGEDAFLMADQCLIAKPYNETKTSVTWENCTLRSWLNGYDATKNANGMGYEKNNFIDAAFTEEEKEGILQADVLNDAYPEYTGKPSDNQTQDKLYLLSASEAGNISYGFMNKYGSNNCESRKADITAYASASGVSNCYWLRTRGIGESSAMKTYCYYGWMDEYNMYEINCAVRPVLHLNLSNTSIWAYAGTVSSDGTKSEILPDDKNNTDVSASPEATQMPDMVQKLDNPTNTRADGSGVTTWDCIWFGNYYQNDTNGDGVADEQDQKQPIKWRVLSVNEDDAFLIADQNIDFQPYNQKYTDITWKNCTLRSWLNGYNDSKNNDKIDYSKNNFINEAFTDMEREAILQSNVKNDANSIDNINTKDKLYLLSIEEASDVAYGFEKTNGIISKSRIAKNTTYAASKNATVDLDGKADDWWLRSIGDVSGYAGEVNSGGDIHLNINTSMNVAVRPVLHLDLSATSSWTYAGKVNSEGEIKLPSLPNETTEPISYELKNPMNTQEDGRGVTTWNCVYFGNYYQNDTNNDGVVDERDQKQPIKWRVLSVNGNDAFLMADKNLDFQLYNQSNTEVTWEKLYFKKLVKWLQCILQCCSARLYRE